MSYNVKTIQLKHDLTNLKRKVFQFFYVLLPLLREHLNIKYTLNKENNFHLFYKPTVLQNYFLVATEIMLGVRGKKEK